MEVFLYAANITLTLVVFLLHLTFTRANYAANRLLSIFLFGCFYAGMMMVLFHTRWIMTFPHFYRTGAICLYIIFPAIYLYTKKIIDQEGWKRSDLVHLVPVIIYLVDYSPFFLLPAQAKADVVRRAFENGGLFSFGETLIFPAYFHFYYRTFLALFYLFLMARLFYLRFLGTGNQVFRQENLLLMKWLALVIALLGLQMLANLAGVLLFPEEDTMLMSTVLVYITNSIMVFFLLFNPRLIYGVKGLWVQEHEPEEAKEELPLSAHAANGRIYLKEAQASRIGEAIEKVLVQERKYLVKGYCMQDLVDDTGYSNHQLSVYINTYLGMNFKEYLNGLRVDHLLREMDRKKSLELFTMDALADLSGFSNRFSFLQSFKKVTGETPSAMLRRKKE